MRSEYSYVLSQETGKLGICRAVWAVASGADAVHVLAPRTCEGGGTSAHTGITPLVNAGGKASIHPRTLTARQIPIYCAYPISTIQNYCIWKLITSPVDLFTTTVAVPTASMTPSLLTFFALDLDRPRMVSRSWSYPARASSSTTYTATV